MIRGRETRDLLISGVSRTNKTFADYVKEVFYGQRYVKRATEQKRTGEGRRMEAK